jgi:hypothetical protein
MRYTLLIILILFISSCSYRITRNYNNSNSNQTSSNCNPLILKKKNLYGLNAKYLGSIKLDDSGISINCSEKKAKETLNHEACSIKSNLINITEEVYPGYSSCYRCIADFYFVDFSDEITKEILEGNNRTILKYDSINKIVWSDFKLSLSDTSSVPYYFVSNIELESGGATFWTGAYKDFKAQGVFYGDVSKVKLSFVSDENLNHIEGLYYLTQIHAKRLEQFLNSDNPKTANRGRVQNLLDQYLNNLSNEQNRYMKETEFGQNNSAQQEWMDKINIELEQLEIEK